MTWQITAEADDNIITTDRVHGLGVGEQVEFVNLQGGTGLTGRAKHSASQRKPLAKPTRYFVIAGSLGARTLKVSATAGGSEVNITADATAGSQMRRAVRAPGDA